MSSENQKYNIDDLASFMTMAKKENKEFVFITGAGCSVTAGIPLAWKIVEELNKEFELQLKSLSEEERKDYGKCMECIEITKRRDYLKKYIDEAKINWAHIALACLLKAGYIRRILTFNFDNLLARSCGLLNLYPATYDFTAANLNMYGLIDDPAIVHLHGQGHGFIQLNTQSETKEHAQQLEEFVRYTLNESPTLFIGYSGKNDAFFPQIEKQFNGQHRLFWVDKDLMASDHLQKSILRSRLANYISCDKGGADTFLILLAQKLECFPPKIFVDPYNHMIDELNKVTGYPLLTKKPISKNEDIQVKDIQNSDEDILLQTKDRLDKAYENEKDRDHPRDNLLEDFLKGNYEKVIKTLDFKDSLNKEESIWLIRSYFNSTTRNSHSEVSIEVYNKVIERFVNSKDEEVIELVARAFARKAECLRDLDRYVESILVVDEFVDKFKDSHNESIISLVAASLLTKSQALGDLKKYKESIETLDYIINDFKTIDSTYTKGYVNIAIMSKMFDLSRLNEFKKAFTILEGIPRDSKFTHGMDWDFHIDTMYGYLYLMQAKSKWKDKNNFMLDLDESEGYLNAALEHLNKSTNESDSFKPWILGKLSYVLFLKGYENKARQFLFKALKAKGVNLYKEMQEDIQQNRIPEDDRYEVFLKDVWSKVKVKS